MPHASIPLASTPHSRANTSSPRAPLTAPAGRSPKAKRALLPASKPRRVSAPYTRIDPPSSLANKTSGFSLAAALSGTLNRPIPISSKPAAATVEETMPRDWFFDIHEDTPEEEASNLMEHSTLCLDLSSDEESSKVVREDRGKENTPPMGYEAPVTRASAASAAASASQSQTQTQAHAKQNKKIQPRRKILKQDEMDDGQRSPLSDLETEDFFAEGLTKDATVIVDAVVPETKKKAGYTCSSLSQELGRTCFPAPEHELGAEDEKVLDVPVVDETGGVAGEIIIFEDEHQENSSPVLASKAVGEKRKRVES